MITTTVLVLSVTMFVMSAAMWLQHRRHRHEMMIMKMAIEGTRSTMMTTLELLRTQNAQTPEQRNREVEALERLWATDPGTTPAPVAVRGEMVETLLREHREGFGRDRTGLVVQTMLKPDREALFTYSPVAASTAMMVTQGPHDPAHLTLMNDAGVTRIIEVAPADLRVIAEGLTHAADRLDQPRPKPLSVWERLRSPREP